MDLEAFKRSPVGDLVPIALPPTRPSSETTQHFAFVPHPLPANPTVGLTALDIATRAAMAVARLDQAMDQLPNPGLLMRPIISREAVSTSALEGTYAAIDEVLEAEFMEERQVSGSVREIRNFVRAAEQAPKLLQERPISRNMIGRLQATIVRGTPGESYDTGDLRQRQVYIGARGRDISLARFIPPPPGDLLLEGFSNWEKWLNERKKVPIVVRMALTHYQFETLHPYSDGNGRLGRLIAVLQLVDDGVLKMPSLNISPWFEQRRNEYIDGLLEVSKTGNFEPWVEFFSTAVLEQAEEGVRTIRDLLNYRDRTIASLRSANVRGIALQVVEYIIGYPVIDVPTVRTLTGRTFEASNQAVARLVDKGVLREITGRSMNRLFACADVLNIITPGR